jgi:hypothetical protein
VFSACRPDDHDVMQDPLDPLLQRLRNVPLPPGSLDGIEQGVWQRIDAGAAFAGFARLRLSLQAAAVAGAFVWGIFSAAPVSDAATQLHLFLVEGMDLLSPSFAGLPL